MFKTLTREELIREIDNLSKDELSVVGRLIQLLTHRAQPRDPEREPEGLGGRWKGVFPEDFDVEKEIAEIRRGHQGRIDPKSVL